MVSCPTTDSDSSSTSKDESELSQDSETFVSHWDVIFPELSEYPILCCE